MRVSLSRTTRTMSRTTNIPRAGNHRPVSIVLSLYIATKSNVDSVPSGSQSWRAQNWALSSIPGYSSAQRSLEFATPADSNHDPWVWFPLALNVQDIRSTRTIGRCRNNTSMNDDYRYSSLGRIVLICLHSVFLLVVVSL